jgi:hypothetical protein
VACEVCRHRGGESNLKVCIRTLTAVDSLALSNQITQERVNMSTRLVSTRLFLGLLLVCFCPGQARSQTQPATCIASKNAHTGALVSRLADWAEIYLNRQDPGRQAESPALAQNSTSLADSAVPTDLATLNFNPSATTTNSRTPKSTDVSSSFSLAALDAAVTQHSPLAAEFYSSGIAEDLRRLSFSVTDSFPGQTSATVSQGSETYALKFQLSRTPSRTRKFLLSFFEEQEERLGIALNGSSMAFATNASVFQRGIVRIRQYIVTQLVISPALLGFDGGTQINEAEAEDRIDTIEKLDESVGCALAAKDQALDSLLEQTAAQLLTDPTMRKLEQEEARAPKVAVESSARLSKGSGPNLYRNQLDYNQTFFKTLTNTINLSFDFQNAQTPSSKNRDIARLADQVQLPFNIYHRDIRSGKLKLTVGGEGDWGSNGAPVYKALGKLTITPFSGIDIPVSVNYSNRTPGLDRGDIRAQVGISVDFLKLWVRPSRSLENVLGEGTR